MFDFDKTLGKFVAPFVAILTVMICIWATIRILEQIWLELLILLGIVAIIAATVGLLWFRFRRW